MSSAKKVGSSSPSAAGDSPGMRDAYKDSGRERDGLLVPCAATGHGWAVLVGVAAGSGRLREGAWPVRGPAGTLTPLVLPW